MKKQLQEIQIFNQHNLQWENITQNNVEPILEGYFHVYKESQNRYKFVQLFLCEDYIKKKSKKYEWKYIHFVNCFINLEENSFIGSGIKLYNQHQQFQFYGQVQSWFEKLKKSCLQVGFNEKYFQYRQISESNVAKVYICENKYTKQDYVAKIIIKEKLKQDLKLVEALKNEIEVLRLIQHPRIAQLIEIFDSENNIYLIFQYYQGGDLLRYIQENTARLSEKDAFHVGKQLLEGLDLLHSLNYMHRDIKPENIFLLEKDSINEIIIGDFGLVEKYNPNQEYNYLTCGTPGFVAPEILRKQQYDYRSDVYGVGIIIYMLITGKEPFESGSEIEKLNLNIKGDIALQQLKISEQAKDLLQRLLQKYPQARLKTKDALNNEYFEVTPQCNFKRANTINIISQQIDSKSEEQSPLTPQKQELYTPQKIIRHNRQLTQLPSKFKLYQKRLDQI